jgi:hypothetical protein
MSSAQWALATFRSNARQGVEPKNEVKLLLVL